VTFLRTWHCFPANTSGVASTPRNCSFFRMVLVAMVAFCTAGSAAAQPSLDALLEPFLARYQIPPPSRQRWYRSGWHTEGRPKVPVTLNDRFHLGSDTKAMTALPAAMLMEEVELRWDSTVAEVFPELVGPMDQGL
jgi:CubicO group peptidase (beta-lactamase class C family)